jgi:hypothetical protein
MENSRNKEFVSFKSHTILSNLVKSCTVLFCTSWDINHSFIQHIHASHTSHPLVTEWLSSIAIIQQSLCSRNLVFLKMTVKHNSSDAGNFVSIYYYNCSVLLLFVVSILMCLIYKLYIVCIGKTCI